LRIRIRIQRKLQEAGKTEDYTFLKNCSRLLRTAELNHRKYWDGKSERNEDRLRRTLSLSPDLEEAHEMLQNFLAILALNEYSLQRLDLGDWIRKYTASMVPEIASAANTGSPKNVGDPAHFSGVSPTFPDALLSFLVS